MIPWVLPPAGITPASAYVPPAPRSVEPPVSYLAEQLAPATGTTAAGVMLRRGEIVSPLRGMDPTDAAVLAALLVRRGSGPAVRDIGHRLDRVDMARETAAEELRVEVLAALDHLIVAGDIADVSIAPSVDPKAEEGSLDVVYTNRRTGQKGARAPLPS